MGYRNELSLSCWVRWPPEVGIRLFFAPQSQKCASWLEKYRVRSSGCPRYRRYKAMFSEHIPPKFWVICSNIARRNIWLFYSFPLSGLAFALIFEIPTIITFKLIIRFRWFSYKIGSIWVQLSDKNRKSIDIHCEMRKMFATSQTLHPLLFSQLAHFRPWGAKISRIAAFGDCSTAEFFEN